MHRSILALSAVLLLGVAPASRSAPLHPDLRRNPPPRLDQVPPEPLIERPSPGVLGAATRFGRRWNPHPRVLVLLVDFEDRPADRVTHDKVHFVDLLFSRNQMEYGSLRDYYATVSYGRMDVTGEMVGWLRMPHPYAYYANGQSGLCSCTPQNARGLANDAFQAAIAAGVDFTAFDNDGSDGIPGSGDDDGILDALVVVFAGIGAERTGSPDDIRSHYWNMVVNSEAQGIRVPDYMMIPEEENVGIPIHEFGHVLGADDLYDLSNRGIGLGNFSVMALGLWFNNGRSPARPDPFTAIEWGMLEPEVPGADEPNMRLSAVADAPHVLRLWTAGEPGPEYFLVENRRPGEIVDKFLISDGLLVYHVDERIRVQSNPSHYRVAVVQADGLWSLEGNEPRSRGDAGDFFPGSENVRVLDDDTDPSTRAYDGSVTRVALRDIGDPGPEVSLRVEVGNFIGGAPRPRLEVVPLPDEFTGRLQPGTRTDMGLRVVNRGTRLTSGTLTLFSADPRVQVHGDPVLTVNAVGSLDSRRLPETIPITVTDRPLSRTVHPLEAVWETEGIRYPMAAPLPLDGVVIRRDGFEEESGDLRSLSLTEDGPAVWVRQRGHVREGEWGWGVSTARGYPGYTDAVLEMGPFRLSGASELRFQHYMDAQAFGEYASDGGFLEVSTDGGATWEVLAPAGGYPMSFTLTEGNAYGGYLCWSGLDVGWEEVVVPLRLEGDVLIRFHFVSDFSGGGTLYDGWFVDTFLLRSWEHTHAGIFDEPVAEEGGYRVGFTVLPVFEDSEPGWVSLVSESGRGRALLGTWNYEERMDASVKLDLAPGELVRLWLEWGTPGVTPVGPLELQLPATPGEPLLRVSPSPVPRSGGAWIDYRVPGSAPVDVRVDLFDVRGARVKRLVEETRFPGPHRVAWPDRSETGRSLAGGVYYLRITGEGFGESRRIVLVP